MKRTAVLWKAPRGAVLCAALFGLAATGQTPPQVTLNDALARARQYAGQIQSATLGAQLAREDTVQAKANRLPTVSAFNQYIQTQGNGTASGVFVANDGVHVYNEQAQVHEELLNVFRHGEVHRALATEAAARARVDIAARGLSTTVVQDYYAIVSAQRKFVNAQTSLKEAQQFLDITDKQEKAGEAAKADVIKARISLQQRERDLQDAQVGIEKAKIVLGILIFPDFSSEFSVADDVETPGVLAPMEEAKSKAASTSPDVKAAQTSLDAAGFDVAVARYGYLPSLGLDFFYGWNANQLTGNALRDDLSRRNFGYSGQVTLNVPVWNWGSTGSKVKQAELKRAQAQVDLSVAKKTLQGNLSAAYAEARAAQQQLDSLKSSLDLSVESLRLTLLRYQAGEAVSLEVVDAQTTVTQARNAWSDGLVRYRSALANLEILTGNL